MKKWYELARARMKEREITQEKLAEHMGVSQGGVAHWLSGRREPSLEVISQVLSYLGLPQMGIEMDIHPDSNVRMAPQPSRSFSYPEISWVQAGIAREATEVLNVALCPHHSSDVWAGDDAFWLRVTGSSMTSTSGPSFPEGTLVLVAPDIEPRPGQFVVARMLTTNEATFKQLARDAGDLYLRPLNPAYSTKLLDESWEIVGTVLDGKMPTAVFV
ncbi:S24 family peptidase [Pseudomonas sp. RP23018S]|uniref:LexA family protein n=1 Tax=Pseudomonas sp. RP23018S TaxID=3096037 RepID=UPI002ACAF28A|nr:S24 family peptidase [Pseudomonas sp. RP23018S]MDZ5601712.1 S24 family peptidase [Pseudomonas sp. RP23018S]